MNIEALIEKHKKKRDIPITIEIVKAIYLGWDFVSKKNFCKDLGISYEKGYRINELIKRYINQKGGKKELTDTDFEVVRSEI